MIKKTIFVFIIILVSVNFNSFSQVNEISESIDEKLSEIHIDDFDITGFKNEIIEGGKIPRADTVFKVILRSVFDEAYNSFQSLFALVIPIMLYGILNALSLKNNGEGVMGIAYMSCYVIICTTVISVFSDIAKLAYETILNNMLARVPNTLDKRQGSIIYNALAPAV